MEINQPNQQTGTESDTASADSLNPDILKQINTQAGMGVLQDMLKSGVFKSNEDPVEDKVAIHLLTHDALKKDKSALKDIANKEIRKGLTNLVEKLGTIKVPLDEKGQEKLRVSVRKLISRLPGMQRVGLEAIDKISGELLKAFVSGDSEDLYKVIEHEINHGKKSKLIEDKVNGIFDGNYKPEEPHDPNQLAKIHKYLEDGELNDKLKQTQNFAEGGEVQQPVADSSNPDQNMMLGMGKARINAYLNSLRPQNNPKLPFDYKLDGKEKNKTYEKALKISEKPLSILDHIPKGTLSPDELKHSLAMHPELHSLMNKKITEKITSQQLANKKPNYKVRQSLALMLRQPLDSTMTPTFIQAAQSTFQPMQPPPAGKPKKDTKKIGDKTNKMYETSTEAAESDRTSRS